MHPARDGSPAGQGVRRSPFRAQAEPRAGEAQEAPAEGRLTTRPPLRVAFAGTPAFAARALEAIAAAGHAIPLVLTQPDRPAGRGLRLSESEVAQCAQRLGAPVLKLGSLRSEPAHAAIRDSGCETLVVAAFGMIVPSEVLAIPARGCLNIHASLLPRWRGAAPIQRAILAGDPRTGITIMRMDAGLDTGPALLQRPVEIGARETSAALTSRLAELGAECIVEALDALDRLVPRPQEARLATYASKVEKAEARIDWTRTNIEIDRQVRAFNPSPGAETRIPGDALKVWQAEPVDGHGAPGAVLQAASTALVVACGTGALRLEVVQRAGGKRMAAAAFLQGRALRAGQILGETAPADPPKASL
ncbi:MAG TPA: methionyl-tRNA formyltransferase [Usitatibacter sp.]|nr:methionyl-tRNA formyltransferase [Usitatibacter sp.]